MVDQGRYCFVTIALIPPGSCVPGTSLAILDHVGGTVVVQSVCDDEKTCDGE